MRMFQYNKRIKSLLEIGNRIGTEDLNTNYIFYIYFLLYSIIYI